MNNKQVMLYVLACIVSFLIGGLVRYSFYQDDTASEVQTFGQVEVRAYTAYDPGNQWADGRVATNKMILLSDYSVAVSPDVEEFIGGISNQHGMHVPGYNKSGEYSMVNDRSDMKSHSVEVLITAGNARERALKWGLRHGILKGIHTPAGNICWIEFKEE